MCEQTPTDQELFDCIKQGDRAAFDQLVLRYHCKLVDWIKKRWSLADAEGIVQKM